MVMIILSYHRSDVVSYVVQAGIGVHADTTIGGQTLFKQEPIKTH